MRGNLRKSPASYACGRLVGYGALFLAGALLGLLLVPEQEAFAAGSIPVLVAGREVAREQDANAAAYMAATRFLAEPFVIVADGQRVELPRSALGARVDTGRLAALIEQARDPRSALRRVRRQLGSAGPVHLPLPVETDPRLVRSAVVRLKDAVEHSPSAPANIQKARHSRQALLLDVHGTIDTIDAAMAAGRLSARARLVRQPEAATGAAHSDIDVSEVVGVFETRFNPATISPQSLFRLRFAAKAIDGKIVPEGETLDFNRIVSGASPAEQDKRSGAGPGDAPSGRSVPDPGYSQAAGTLHGAVLFAGLPILERHPHGHTPEHIKLGLDAVAGLDDRNLRFRNDLPFPVVVGMSVERGSVRAELRGARRTRTVTFKRTIVSAMPFKKRFIEDPGLPRGIRILARRGVPGFIVRSVKTVKHGSGTSEADRHQNLRSVYRPVTERWRIGTASLHTPVEQLPENDTRPEFLQDEHLIATQGPDIRGFDIHRIPGITGAHGWTSRGQFATN